jgi:hypothetical protein
MASRSSIAESQAIYMYRSSLCLGPRMRGTGAAVVLTRRRMLAEDTVHKHA